jgi:hypothetical protein
MLLSHLRHQKLIYIPYFLLHSLHNMAYFVKKSKNPKNCLSNHRLIGLLICKGMSIPNDPLLEVEEKPIHVLAVMADLEQPNPRPSTAPVVKAPTVTSHRSTLITKCKRKITSNTTQKSIDSVELEQLNPIHTIVIEPTIDNAIHGPSHEP